MYRGTYEVICIVYVLLLVFTVLIVDLGIAAKFYY